MAWCLKSWAVLMLLFSFIPSVKAQPMQYAIGRCVDQVNQIAWDITPDLHVWNVNFPGYNFQAMRDPAGMYFLRLPANQPWRQAFFVSWDLRLVQLDIALPGPIVIGNCNFMAAALPSPIHIPQFDMTLAQNRGVLDPNGNLIRPPRLVLANANANASAIAMPGVASPASAEECFDKTGPDQQQFAECMVPKMLTPAQIRAYNCTKAGDGDRVLVSACLAKQVVGPNEAKAIDQATNCYKKHAEDYKKYPLCMASQNFDPKTAATVNCFTSQAQQGNVSPWSTAACAAGAQLGFNPELTIAVECAVESGGEPHFFVGCTAGRLTARELEKCFTDGIGGDGCFGPNNDIVKGLKMMGLDAGNLTNPNGAVVNAWNTVTHDIQYGPGPNNDVYKVVNTINNDLTHGLGKNNDIRKFAENIGLGGLF